MEIPDICPLCGEKINRIPPGVSKRTGKPYGAFFACANRDCKFTWTKQGNRPKTATNTKDQIIMEELSAINRRLDDMGKYLNSKLG